MRIWASNVQDSSVWGYMPPVFRIPQDEDICLQYPGFLRMRIYVSSVQDSPGWGGGVTPVSNISPSTVGIKIHWKEMCPFSFILVRGWNQGPGQCAVYGGVFCFSLIDDHLWPYEINYEANINHFTLFVLIIESSKGQTITDDHPPGPVVISVDVSL